MGTSYHLIDFDKILSMYNTYLFRYTYVYAVKNRLSILDFLLPKLIHVVRRYSQHRFELFRTIVILLYNIIYIVCEQQNLRFIQTVIECSKRFY